MHTYTWKGIEGTRGQCQGRGGYTEQDSAERGILGQRMNGKIEILLFPVQSKGLSRVFSNIAVQEHQFFSTQLSLWSNSHIHI